jgi:hypothetical protein
MDKSELEKRTKLFALRIIKFVAALPRNKANDVLGYQLVKCGTSIGANYREANRAESRNDFIHKIGIWRRKPPRHNTGWSSAMRRTSASKRSDAGY